MRFEESAFGAAMSPAPHTDPLQLFLSAVKPVAVTLSFAEVTVEDYDRLLAALALTPRGAGLPGCLFHWMQLAPDGWVITEVWQNRPLFDVYRRDEMEPTYLRLQLPAPQITMVPVHNYLASDGMVD